MTRVAWLRADAARRSRARRAWSAAALAFVGGAALAQRGDRADEPQPRLPAELAIPAAPARSPEEELATFALPDGLAIDLVAAEPLVHDPVAAAFDEDGRLWVVEMRGFMPNVDGRGEREPCGSVVVLTDRDGDGRMDERRVFLSRLVLPRAVAPARGGALVVAPPELWFCRDTDGDGAADETTVVDHVGSAGLDNPEHAINGLVFGADGAFRCANAAVAYRYDGERWVRERTAGGGQWGITRDDAGRFLFDTNSDPLRGDLVPSRYAVRNPSLGTAWGVNLRLAADFAVWPSRATPGVNRGYREETLREDFTLASVTAACGPLVHRGDALGAPWQGSAFVCEPAGNLVARYALVETDGALAAEHAWDGRDFLTSTDERFRPVNLLDGPDGALYVVDMYRGVLQHRVFVTTFLREQIVERGLERPLGLGRIWRVRPRAWERTPPARLSDASWSELVALLSHRSGWWRDVAQRLLVEEAGGEREPLELLREHARTSASALGRLHAIWTLAAIGGLQRTLVEDALRDPDERVRIAAVRAAEPWLAAGDAELVARLTDVARGAGAASAGTGAGTSAGASGGGSSDPTDAVRAPSRREVRQVLLSLGEARTSDADAALLALMERWSEHAEERSLALSGLGGRELDCLERIVATPSWAEPRAGRAQWIAALARCVVVEGISPRIERLLAIVAAAPRECRWQAQAIAAGILSGRELDARGQPARVRLASEPRELLASAASGTPAEDLRLEDLLAALTWPGREGAQDDAAPRALDEEERARFERGRATYLAVCAACHQPSGRGEPGKAPTLRGTDWVLGDAERLASLVLCGMEGPLLVAGERWSMEMPAFAESDEIVAGVLTYVRREWGNGADPVTPEIVTRARSGARTRAKPWTAEELRAAYE